MEVGGSESQTSLIIDQHGEEERWQQPIMNDLLLPSFFWTIKNMTAHAIEVSWSSDPFQEKKHDAFWHLASGIWIGRCWEWLMVLVVIRRLSWR